MEHFTFKLFHFTFSSISFFRARGKNLLWKKPDWVHFQFHFHPFDFHENLRESHLVQYALAMFQDLCVENCGCPDISSTYDYPIHYTTTHWYACWTLETKTKWDWCFQHFAFASACSERCCYWHRHWLLGFLCACQKVIWLFYSLWITLNTFAISVVYTGQTHQFFRLVWIYVFFEQNAEPEIQYYTTSFHSKQQNSTFTVFDHQIIESFCICIVWTQYVNLPQFAELVILGLRVRIEHILHNAYCTLHTAYWPNQIVSAYCFFGIRNEKSFVLLHRSYAQRAITLPWMFMWSMAGSSYL